MAETQQQSQANINYVELSAEIISAYVTKNHIQADELPALIGTVHKALKDVGEGKTTADEALREPIVPINKTIRPEYIVSLEDGKRYRSLKRHLTSKGLTPEQYRAKWGLPPTYPMTAPAYSKRRSELARALGLGQARKGAGKAAKKASKASKKASKKVAA